MCQSEIRQVIEVVESVEAKKRLPDHITTNPFSPKSVWKFQATNDSKTCQTCNGAEEVPKWYGNHLRLFFPYLEVVDDFTIYPHAHPNCRCVLKLYIGEPQQ